VLLNLNSTMCLQSEECLFGGNGKEVFVNCSLESGDGCRQDHENHARLVDKVMGKLRKTTRRMVGD
jgi:hypothetical protein